MKEISLRRLWDNETLYKLPEYEVFHYQKITKNGLLYVEVTTFNCGNFIYGEWCYADNNESIYMDRVDFWHALLKKELGR